MEENGNTSQFTDSEMPVRRNRRTRILAKLGSILGGGFFGAFVSAFPSHVATGSAKGLVVFTLLGFVGLVLIFVGLVFE